VATYKAQNAYNLLNKPVLVEDTSLAFIGLNGLPGALIKSFLQCLTLQQIVDLLKENREAIAKTCLAYCDNNGVRLFTAEILGQIAKEPKGEKGFGWDSIFIPSGQNKTFGEMEPEEKNKFSMRQKAAEKLKGIVF
jgi:XTP/dITP diphosphohydrolase